MDAGVSPNFGQSNPPPGFFTDVSAGEFHTCGVKTDRTIACWGAGTFDMKGDSFNRGQAAPPPGDYFVQVSAGALHTCALRESVRETSIKCWGDNSLGQLNNPYLGHPTTISAGGDHTCASDYGNLSCWDCPSIVDCRTGVTFPPEDLFSHAYNFSQVSLGSHHACGIVQSDSFSTPGGILCWGANDSGQTDPISETIQVSAGGFHTCGLIADGSIKCWGNNDYGQSSP
jgi:alpha-tubulin suppressor-like RCC1 family protein